MEDEGGDGREKWEEEGKEDGRSRWEIVWFMSVQLMRRRRGRDGKDAEE